jgi:phenylacetic acid degradation protein
MFYEFNGYKPVVHPTAFVHPQAVVTGHVVIGKHVYIGPGCALRGDWGKIVIHDHCNVQENCTVHMFPGVTVTLHERAHIGHGAVIHGAEIGKNVLVGMNAVIMDRVKIGDESIVGALAFVKADSVFEPRSLIVGNPAQKVREISEEMVAWKSAGTQIYMELPDECRRSLRPCEPLTEEPAWYQEQKEVSYKTWQESKNSKDNNDENA